MDSIPKENRHFTLVCKMAGLTRLELATFRVTGGRSNQTELQPHMAPRTGLEPVT